MKLNKINAVLILIGIHAFCALFVLLFGKIDTSNIKVASTAGKIIFLGVKSHSASVPAFESKSSDEKTALFTTSLEELAKINVSPHSPSILKSRAVVLLPDADDAVAADNDLQTLFDKLSNSVPLICVAVPPVDNRVVTNKANRQILEFNQILKQHCAAKDNCSYLDLSEYFADADGNLKPIYHTGDGVSFNERGSQIWKDAINSLVQ